jgi:lipopolysaccharide export system protein LptA
MAKKLILGIATLAIMVALFGLYQSVTTAPAMPIGSADDALNEGIEALLDASAEPKETISVGGVNLPGGENVTFHAYAEDGRVLANLQVDAWEPISEREFELTAPRVEWLLPGGQRVFIEADEARMVGQAGGKRNLDPKSGWLKGHVHVYIDLTKPAWREANPDQAAPEQHPDEVVHIWMDEVTFDLDLSRLETEARFRIQAAIADVEGTGLMLRWNEPANRIEDLRITQVDRMELRRGTDMIQFALPGTTVDEKSGDRPAGDRSTAMAPVTLDPKGDTSLSQQPLANQSIALPARVVDKPAKPPPMPVTTQPLPPAVAQGALIQLAREKSEKKPPKIDVYRARFEGPVTVEQRVGIETQFRLTAPEALELVFDFESKRSAQQAGVATTKPAEEKETADKKHDQAEPATGSGPASRVVLTCGGEFRLKPAQDQDEPPTGERFRAVATGVPVIAEQTGQGKAEGVKLVYEREAERVWLDGDDARQASISTADGQRIAARKLYFDRQTGVGRLDGAGEMRSFSDLTALGEDGQRQQPTTAPADEPKLFRIAWTDHVDLKFDQVRLRTVDGETGQASIKTRDVPKRATFYDNVSMEQEGQSLAADQIDVRFAMPTDAGEVGRSIDEVRANGHVVLESDSDTVTCLRLVIEMDDENRPEVARAIGSVRAEQREPMPMLARLFGEQAATRVQRFINADDRLVVRFGSFPRHTEPFDLEKARAIARERGHDPDTIDWDAVARREAAKTDLRIVSMEAVGDVEGRDLPQRFEVRGDQVTVGLEAGRRIDDVHIIGTPERFAVATMGDYLISGAVIDADLVAEQADVPGPGRVEFTSAEALDGRKRDEPTPVVITWTKSMALRGPENYAIFDGHIHAATADSTLDCTEQLRAELVSLPPTPVMDDPSEARTLWLLRPFLRTGAKASSPSDRLLGDGVDTGRFEKRITRLIASGDAKVLSSDFSDDGERLNSRTLLTGPKLAVDVENEHLNIEGAGNLLVEDYRIVDPKAKRSSGSADEKGSGTLLGSMASSGPSHTLITWGNSMSFFVRDNLAVFDRDITLRHRSGTELALLEDLARAMKVDTEALRNVESRRAELTADDHLTVRFARSGKGTRDGSGLDRLGGTELDYFDARKHVRMQEGDNFVVGERVTYVRHHEDPTRDRVTVRSARDRDASLQLGGESERSVLWHGPVIYWSPVTNKVDAPGAKMQFTRR